MENIKRGNVGNNGTIYLFEEKLFKYDKKESTTYEQTGWSLFLFFLFHLQHTAQNIRIAHLKELPNVGQMLAEIWQGVANCWQLLTKWWQEVRKFCRS